MNFIIPSSTYSYVKFWALVSRQACLPKPWRRQARNILQQVSGVEPSLFLHWSIFDRRSLKIKERAVKRILRQHSGGGAPLTNGRHGVRVHGFTSEAGLGGNKIFYARDFAVSVAALREQIFLTKKLAVAAGVDDNKYPSILNIHLGGSDGSRQAELDNLVKIFKAVLPVARANQVYINLENVWDSLSGYSLGSGPEDLIYLFSQLPDEYLAMTFDVSHALIHYRGDYQKIKEVLVSNNLLSRINYLHFSAPEKNYRIKNYQGRIKSWFGPIGYLLFYHPDNHAGLLPLPAEEQQQLLDLVDFLVKKSKVAEPRFNVINLELGMKVWGTDKGATVGDLSYTLEEIKKVIR